MVIHDFQKFWKIKGFYQKFSHAELAGLMSRIVTIVGRHHDKPGFPRTGSLLKILNVPDRHETVQTRHPNITKHKMEKTAFCFFNPFKPVPGNINTIAASF